MKKGKIQTKVELQRKGVELVKSKKYFLFIMGVLLFYSLFPPQVNANLNNPTNTFRVDGDSFGLAFGDANSNNIFPNRVARTMEVDLNNASVSGELAVVAWNKIKSDVSVPSIYNYHLLNVGFNDVRKYGNLPNFDQDLKNRITAIVAYLRLESIIDDNNTNIQYTGTWNVASVPDSYGGFNMYTSVPGAYASYAFDGDKVSVGTFVLGTAGSVMEIKVDGVVKKTFSNDYQTGNGYCSSAIEITGLGNGAHTLTITKTDTTNGNMYIDWIGMPSNNPPIIIYNGITKMKASEYDLHSPNNKGSDKAIYTANKAIREGLAEFDEKVVYIDQSDYDPNEWSLTVSDGVHPNNLGHEWIASNIIRIIH